jgi:hypothetical protein
MVSILVSIQGGGEGLTRAITNIRAMWMFLPTVGETVYGVFTSHSVSMCVAPRLLFTNPTPQPAWAVRSNSESPGRHAEIEIDLTPLWRVNGKRHEDNQGLYYVANRGNVNLFPPPLRSFSPGS